MMVEQGWPGRWGVRFLDAAGQEVAAGGGSLAEICQIDTTGLDPRLNTEIVVACDVDNPLCGTRGASAVFGPQKGATPEMVQQLMRGWQNTPKCRRPGAMWRKSRGRSSRRAGAGLMFFTPVQSKPGVEIVLDAVGFSDIVRDADFVITGEGRTDFQTAFGKAPVACRQVAKTHGAPVFCISGGLGEADDVLAQGIDAVMKDRDRPLSLEECMAAGAQLIGTGGG